MYITKNGSSQLAYLPWTTMGLFSVLLCITNTCSMTAMMAGGEVHRPSAVQQDIWNWVTLCSWTNCRKMCKETVHGVLIWSAIWWVHGFSLNTCTSCFNFIRDSTVVIQVLQKLPYYLLLKQSVDITCWLVTAMISTLLRHSMISYMLSVKGQLKLPVNSKMVER